MYIFCSKALADALNIKKNELQKMPADAQMDDLYAWHGHITKLNGKNTICDSIDAITSNRCYRKAHNFDYCYEEIEKLYL